LDFLENSLIPPALYVNIEPETHVADCTKLTVIETIKCLQSSKYRLFNTWSLYNQYQVLYNQFSPYILCRVSWLPIRLDWMSISSKAFPSITTYAVYEKYSITQDKESMG
jgi:hypothetical protein